MGLNADVDMVALSFVQRPEDIDDVRRIMDEQESIARSWPRSRSHRPSIICRRSSRRSTAPLVARGDHAELPRAGAWQKARRTPPRRCR